MQECVDLWTTTKGGTDVSAGRNMELELDVWRVTTTCKHACPAKQERPSPRPRCKPKSDRAWRAGGRVTGPLSLLRWLLWLSAAGSFFVHTLTLRHPRTRRQLSTTSCYSPRSLLFLYHLHTVVHEQSPLPGLPPAGSISRRRRSLITPGRH